MSIPGNRDASVFIQRKVTAIVMDMPGVYTWKQRCIRLHPEESRSHSYGHAWCLYLETEMHPPSSRGKSQPQLWTCLVSIPGNRYASAFIQRKVAAIVMDMPGVYTWKQICIRLHPEESRSHSYGHAWRLYLETEMHPPSSREIFLNDGWVEYGCRYARIVHWHMRNPANTEMLT